LVGSPSVTLYLRRLRRDVDVVAKLCDFGVDLEMPPVHYRLAAGRSIALVLSAADFPEFWRNLSGGGYEVVSGPACQSMLRLSVVEPSVEPDAARGSAFAPPVGQPSSSGRSDSAAAFDPASEVATVHGLRTYELVNDDAETSRIRHEFTISTHTRRPMETQVRTRTAVGEGGPDERTIQASCAISPDASSATLQVTSAEMDEAFDYSLIKVDSAWIDD
jgi:hypothetical protein